MRTAVVERPGLLLLSDEGRVTDRRRYEVLVPRQEITNGRQETTIPVDVLERHVGVKSLFGVAVGNRAVRHDARVIVTPGGVRHPQRLEEPLPRELGKWQA